MCAANSEYLSRYLFFTETNKNFLLTKIWRLYELANSLFNYEHIFRYIEIKTLIYSRPSMARTSLGPRKLFWMWVVRTTEEQISTVEPRYLELTYLEQPLISK